MSSPHWTFSFHPSGTVTVKYFVSMVLPLAAAGEAETDAVVTDSALTDSADADSAATLSDALLTFSDPALTDWQLSETTDAGAALLPQPEIRAAPSRQQVITTD